MNARDVVAQRITTLDGLLASPSGPFSGRGGPLAERLAAGWHAERRLLQRILDESRGADLQATIGLWNERTAAFLERSEEGAASWHDRDGHVWYASDVLRILEDLERRIDTWLAEDGAPAPGVPGGSTAQPSAADGAQGAQPAPRGRGDASLGPRGASSAPVPDEADDAVGHQGPDGALDDEDDADDLLMPDPALDDDDDDDDDDARYVRVNEPLDPT